MEFTGKAIDEAMVVEESDQQETAAAVTGATHGTLQTASAVLNPLRSDGTTIITAVSSGYPRTASGTISSFLNKIASGMQHDHSDEMDGQRMASTAEHVDYQLRLTKQRFHVFGEESSLPLNIAISGNFMTVKLNLENVALLKQRFQ